MDRRLVRFTTLLLPLSILIALISGRTTATGQLLFFYFLTELLSGCAPDSFRNAAAREPGPRRVDRRFYSGITQWAIGFLIAMPLGCFIMTSQDRHIMLGAALSGGLLPIVEFMVERLYTGGRRIDGGGLTGLTAALLLAGQLLDGGIVTDGWGAFAGTMLSLFASLLLCFKGAHSMGYEFLPQNYPYAPKAILQTLLFPAVVAALYQTLHLTLLGIAVGWGMWRLARTTFRRSSAESRAMDFWFVTFTAVMIIAARWVPFMTTFNYTVTLSLLCAVALFQGPSWRIYTGTALCVIAAVLPEGLIFSIACCVLGVAASAVNVHHAFLKRR